MTPGRRVAALGLLAAGLGGLILAEFFELPSDHTPVAASRIVAPPQLKPAEDSGGGAQQQWIASLLGRPPLSPARRPAAVATAGPHDAAGPGMPRLAGILISPDRKLAIFAAGAAKPVAAIEGDPVGSYHVLSIEAAEVVVHGADGTHVLHLSFGAGQSRPAPRTGLAASVATAVGVPDSD